MISESEGGQPVVQGGHRAAAGLVSGSPGGNKALIGGCLVRRVMSGRGGFRLCHRAMFRVAISTYGGAEGKKTQKIFHFDLEVR